MADHPRPSARRDFADLFQVAAPLIISMGSYTLMQFCNRVFLAWYDPVALQASLPAGILSYTLICGFLELAGYGNTFVAQYHGAGQHHGCSRATGQAVWIALVSWPFLLALMPLGLWILQISGHPPKTTEAEIAYFRILMAGGVAAPLGVAFGTFFTGRGRTRVTMVVNLAGNALNILLDYALIFGRLGCPEMGIRGAALATVISGLVVAAIFLVLFLSPSLNRAYATRTAFRPEWPLLKRMIRFGAPASVNVVLDVGSFSVFMLLVGRMGEQALTTSNMALAVNNAAFMPLVGLSVATATLVGQHQGRGDSAGAERMTWMALKTGALYMLCTGASFVLAPKVYLSFFTRFGHGSIAMDEILPLARLFMIMMALWGLFDNVNMVLSGCLKGAGDTRFVMIYTLAMAWGLWVPGQFVILSVLHGGPVRLWAWLTLYVMVLAIGYFIRFRSGRWKAIEVIEHPHS